MKIGKYDVPEIDDKKELEESYYRLYHLDIEHIKHDAEVLGISVTDVLLIQMKDKLEDVLKAMPLDDDV